MSPRDASSARSSALSLEVHAGTTAPLDVWAAANVVLYERLLFTGSMGVAAYQRTVDSVAQRFGDEGTSAIVSPILFGAMVFRLGVGLRPFGKSGPEALVGYARLMGSATWDAGSFGAPARFGEISADVGINALFVELGWAIDVGRAFVRPALGWMRPMGANVAVSAADVTDAQAATAQAVAGDAIESAFDSFSGIPTLSLSLGARFSLER